VRRRLQPALAAALDRTFLGLDFAALHRNLWSAEPRHRDAGSVKTKCSGTTTSALGHAELVFFGQNEIENLIERAEIEDASTVVLFLKHLCLLNAK